MSVFPLKTSLSLDSNFRRRLLLLLLPLLVLLECFCLESVQAAAAPPAKCFRCITDKPSEKASCVNAVECDLPGRCFKAVLHEGLTIRGCPLGPEADVTSIFCGRVPGMMTSVPGLKAKFTNAQVRARFDASCPSKAGAKVATPPQIHLCRGAACNGAQGFKPSNVVVPLVVLMAMFCAKLR